MDAAGISPDIKSIMAGCCVAAQQPCIKGETSTQTQPQTTAP